MIHLSPLPGSPRYSGDFEAVISTALDDANALVESGFDGVMIENYGDIPFFADEVPAVTIASMARCVSAVRSAHPNLPIGVNVLRNDAIAALSIAHACEANFIRVNVLSGAVVSDQGLIQGRAAELVRLRHAGASPSQMLAEVGVQHAAPLADISLIQSAQDTAYRGCADALIVSGTGTGAPTSMIDVETVMAATPTIPVLIGSGMNLEYLGRFRGDGCIVGTALKKDGLVCPSISSQFVKAFRAR